MFLLTVRDMIMYKANVNQVHIRMYVKYPVWTNPSYIYIYDFKEGFYLFIHFLPN